MQKNSILLKENFYSTRKGRIGLNTTLSMYFILIVSCIILSTMVSPRKINSAISFNRDAAEFFAINLSIFFFAFMAPSVGIFKIFMYTRLIKNVYMKNDAIELKMVFGRRRSIINYEVLLGAEDYAKSYRFFLWKGENYINEPLFINKGVNYTIKDLDTGTYYLLTVVDDEVGENKDF